MSTPNQIIKQYTLWTRIEADIHVDTVYYTATMKEYIFDTLHFLMVSIPDLWFW